MDLPTLYHLTVEWSLEQARISASAAHVHVGMLIYLSAQLVLPDRRASLHALTIVFALAALNEAMDRLFWGSWRWADTLGDFTLTMLWPTICVLVGRYRRNRWLHVQRHRSFLKNTGDAAAAPSARALWVARSATGRGGHRNAS